MSKILGLGNDIIEISRIENDIQEYGNRFLDRLFTEAEQNYCNKFRDSARHYAGRFAAKEAIVKALGTGFGKEATFLDIEILPDSRGKPEASFSENLINHFGELQILLSISHCKTFATAVAIWQSNS